MTEIHVLLRNSEMLARTIAVGAFKSAKGANTALTEDMEELDTDREDYEIVVLELRD